MFLFTVLTFASGLAWGASSVGQTEIRDWSKYPCTEALITDPVDEMGNKNPHRRRGYYHDQTQGGVSGVDYDYERGERGEYGEEPTAIDPGGF
ncbi:MAG: hypothetical protein AB7F86_07815 [Bdellovibrionales bacterium]